MESRERYFGFWFWFFAKIALKRHTNHYWPAFLGSSDPDTHVKPDKGSRLMPAVKNVSTLVFPENGKSDFVFSKVVLNLSAYNVSSTK